MEEIRVWSCSVCCRSGCCHAVSQEPRIGQPFTNSEAHHHDDRAEGKSSRTTSQDGRSVQSPPMSDGGSGGPGNDTTFQQRKRPQTQLHHCLRKSSISSKKCQSIWRERFCLSSLKSAPRGSSPGPGGWTYEHLKGMLDDTDTFEWLLSACNSL